MQHLIETYGDLIRINALRYIFIAGIPFLLFYLLLSKRFSKRKIQSRNASRKDFIREVGYSFLTVTVFAMVGLLVLFTPLKQYTLVYNNINDYPVWWVAASTVLSLVIHDTYFYWMHRALHHKAIFKHAHVVHHKSTNPSPLASYSFHFFEAWTEGAILLPLVFILPMHPIAIALFVLLGFIINVYGHLGYELTPRWFRHTFLFEILNTSVHHNLHHSKFNGNYGLYFRIWDRLMKTEHPDYVKEYDKIQHQRFGDT